MKMKKLPDSISLASGIGNMSNSENFGDEDFVFLKLNSNDTAEFQTSQTDPKGTMICFKKGIHLIDL